MAGAVLPRGPAVELALRSAGEELGGDGESAEGFAGKIARGLFAANP